MNTIAEITYHAGYMTVNTSQEVIIVKLSDLIMKDRQALKDATKYLYGCY